MRRGAFALALFSSAAALTACGSVRDAVDPVAAAVSKTEKAGGFDLTMKLDASVGGRTMTMSAHGSVGDSATELTVDMGSTTAHVVSDVEGGDPILYMDVPGLAGELPHGKKWVRIDVAKAGKAAGFDLGSLMSSAANTSQSLDVLKSGADFSSVGSDTIDGVSTTHYRGTVDLSAAASALGSAADALKQLENLGALSKVTVDVWVDDQGYVRRQEERYDESVLGNSVSLDLTTDMTNYGKTADVALPSADEVYDGTGIASQGLQGMLNKGPTA